MAAVDILSLVTGAADATRSVAEKIQSIRGQAKAAETIQALTDAQEAVVAIESQILALQQAVIDLQKELASAQKENSKLRAQLSEKADEASQHRKPWFAVREGED